MTSDGCIFVRLSNRGGRGRLHRSDRTRKRPRVKWARPPRGSCAARIQGPICVLNLIPPIRSASACLLARPPWLTTSPATVSPSTTPLRLTVSGLSTINRCRPRCVSLWSQTRSHSLRPPRYRQRPRWRSRRRLLLRRPLLARLPDPFAHRPSQRPHLRPPLSTLSPQPSRRVLQSPLPDPLLLLHPDIRQPLLVGRCPPRLSFSRPRYPSRPFHRGRRPVLLLILQPLPPLPSLTRRPLPFQQSLPLPCRVISPSHRTHPLPTLRS